MTPEFKAAGIAVLRFAYAKCKKLHVPNDEIADLLNALGDAVRIGQTVESVPLKPAKLTYHRVTAAEHKRIVDLHAQGFGCYRISQMLSIPKSTVANHLERETISPSPEPRSAPASG